MSAARGWRRGASALLGAVLVVPVVAGGCGVPSESGVVTQGPGGAPGRSAGTEGILAPEGRAATIEPEKFVQNFLAAAAGAPGGAVSRVKQFLMPEASSGWEPSPVVNIVRLTPNGLVRTRTTTGWSVKLDVIHVGRLGKDGIVEPQVARPATYRFSIVEGQRSGGGGLFIDGPPPLLLLSDAALREYYVPRTLYFWSADGSTLVPDLRYLPGDVPESQRPTEVVKWLLAGPSKWLESAVPPAGGAAQLVGNVPAGDRLEVTVSKAADAGDANEMKRLAIQLRWSLRGIRPGADGTLELRVGAVRSEFTDDDYLAANPAYRGDARPKPLRFCVYQQQVRRLGREPEPSQFVPELPAASNGSVQSAALRRDGQTAIAALVRTVGAGQQALYAGTITGSATEQVPRTNLTAHSIGQPVLLPGPGGMGLVIADGELLKFASNTRTVGEVPSAGRGITAMAIPPDGRRLAYILGEKVYVASLQRDGTAVTLGSPQVVPTGLTDLDGVAWSQESWLVVAGRGTDGRTALFDITVDGAMKVDRSVEELGQAPITHLVASADDPGDGAFAGQVMYVANDVAYELFSESRQLTAQEVAGVTSSTTPPTLREATPKAPFFVD